MNTERLERLAALMDTVSKEEKPFLIDYWLSPSVEPCGFAACAIGWAALDPWFQDQGLILSRPAFEGGVWRERQVLTTDDVSKPDALNFMPPKIRGSVFGYIAAFFGLSAYDARRLFTEDGYSRKATAADVAYEIRQLLASAPVS